MFKRLYASGGFAYVLGGIGVLAMIPCPVLLGLLAMGFSVSENLLIYSGVALLIGGMVSQTIFDGHNMQVVAQNRTTEAVERLSEQLEEEKLRAGRNRGHRTRQRKQRVR